MRHRESLVEANALEHQHTLAHTREPQVLNLLALLVARLVSKGLSRGTLVLRYSIYMLY